MRAAEGSAAEITFAAVVDMGARRPNLFPRFDPETLERAAVEERLASLSASVRSLKGGPVEVSTKVLLGEPATAVIEAVMADGYDLVIKAPAGPSRRRLDTTEMRLLRGCPCAVNITRPGEQEHFQRLLVAVDVGPSQDSQSELNHAILRCAAAMQQVAYPEIHVVHAWSLYGESLLTSGGTRIPEEDFDKLIQDERSFRQGRLDELLRDYEALVGGGSGPRPAPKLHLVHGDPIEAIPSVAKEIDAQLLVMSTASRTRVRGFLIGNTAESVLNVYIKNDCKKNGSGDSSPAGLCK